MANLNAARGFRPVRYSDNKAYLGAQTKYYCAGGAVLGVGDPIVRVTGGTAADPAGVAAAVVRATTGSYITGVIVGFDANPANLQEVGYRGTGDTNYYVYVADEPDLIFEVQEGGSGSALTTANIGQSINSITAVNANTTIGTSLFQIDNATVTTSDTGTWIIVGLVQRADVATGQYARWLVKPNLHTEVSAGAAGVLAI